MKLKQLLLKHWGYNSFRPGQEEIINSILSGRDTLSLMPTGAGKSICFQLPAMAMEGLCLVISPLIALMKDQVLSLHKKGINAVAVYSGMHRTEIDITLNKCIFGDVKLLYMSPERLKTDIVRLRLPRMKINLIAVDEAHCISEWGYDFRPPYLEIGNIRSLFPNTPVLALSASATGEIIKDIQNKLLFKNENVIRVSFERRNIIYLVNNETDKLSAFNKFVKFIDGKGIIYVRSRRKTSEIAEYLNRNNFSATFYNAGMDMKSRHLNQNEWMSGKKRIIVCTSAFGMGIDKPDVRFVIHFDCPSSLEEYYQEAGRAGRDNKTAWCILLFNDSDEFELKKNLLASYPEINLIKSVYNALGNFYQLAVGCGQDTSFDFNIFEFSKNYGLDVLTTYNSLKILDREGYINFFETFHSASRLRFIISKNELYKFQVENKEYVAFTKTLLRTYGGLFNDFVYINEDELSKNSQIPKEIVGRTLEKLDRLNVITYIPRKYKPQIIFCQSRINSDDIYISEENYALRKAASEKRIKNMISYAKNTNKCRSQQILSWFGETDTVRCGLCDFCTKRNKAEASMIEFDNIIQTIKPLLRDKPLSIEEIITAFPLNDKTTIIKVISWLRDNNKIILNNDNKYKWN
ncbi:MAG: RecQ family ATP-dependent DNA helicase [Bacteroidales bacterium]|nr:RecQ family ATP-dependent DNA helicase [Bacteroidales bacterium]